MEKLNHKLRENHDRQQWEDRQEKETATVLRRRKTTTNQSNRTGKKERYESMSLLIRHVYIHNNIINDISDCSISIRFYFIPTFISVSFNFQIFRFKFQYTNTLNLLFFRAINKNSL